MRVITIVLFLFLLEPVSAAGSGAEMSFLQSPKTTQKNGVPAQQQPVPGVVGGRQRAPGRRIPPAPQALTTQTQQRPAATPGEEVPDQSEPDEPQTDEPQSPPGAAAQSPQRASGVPSQARSNGSIFAFSNAPIEDVVDAIMKELGYSYVIDPQVSGTVNIYSHGEIPREKLFGVLEQLLNMNGQGIVRQEDFYVVLPLTQTAKVPGRILMRPSSQQPGPPPESRPEEQTGEQEPPVPPEPGPGNPPASTAQESAGEPGPSVRTLEPSQEAAQLEEEQGVITYIIPLYYLPSSEMVTLIKAFVSEGAQIVDFQTANILILTDYRANIQQALSLIELLDTRYFDINTVDLVPVRYHQAVDVAEDLGKIFAPGDKAGGVRIVAIERLNSILIVTHAPAVFAEVKRWIDKLDAPSAGTNVRTFVYQVENNTAANIAEILAQLYEDGAGLPSGPVEEPEEGRPRPATTPRRDAGFLPERGQMQQLGPALGGRSPESGVRAVVSGNIKIIVNEFNNSLIIQGTESDYQFLEQTIKQLDVLPRQALIEARIYSVELRDDLSYGVAAFLQEKGADLPPATTGSISAPGEGSTGGALSIATRIALGGERQLDIFLNALRNRTNVEIVEAPTLMVLDGTEAQINVGAEVPVSTGSFSDPVTSGSSTAFVNTIQFRPTGTTLLLMPRISASGIITMDLAIEVSQATGSGLTPTINRNFVRTSMIARDNDTIAIAGVISDSSSLSKDRVPLLGDIPILGALFGQTSRSKRRFELLFLITPRVIRNFPTAVELSLDFRRALRNSYDFIQRKESEEKELMEKRRREELGQLQSSPPPG